MELIGSQASPFVRRIRMLLHGRAYKFTTIDVFSPEGQAYIAPYTKTRKIPVLIDGDQAIFDSWLISEHLLNRSLSLEEKKDLVLINDACTSGINVFQMKKFDLDPELTNRFSQNQLNIISSCLDYFEEKLQRTELPWEITGMWLYCMLDWFSFRNVFEWRTDYMSLIEFMNNKDQRPEVEASDPKK